MKFNDSLDDEAVMEWYPKYIAYRKLKKIIKNSTVAREVAERTRLSTKVPTGSPPGSPIRDRKTLSALDDKLHQNMGSPYPSTGQMSNASAASSTGTATKDKIIDDEDMDLPEVHFYRSLPDLFDADVDFFREMNKEVYKVNDFYMEQEDMMTKSVALIIAKLQDPLNEESWERAKDVKIPEEYLPKEEVERRRSGIISRVASSVKESGVGEEEEQAQAQRYLKQKEQARVELNRITKETYSNLELLKNFQHLNTLACSKILKKFDKRTGHKSREGYLRAIHEKAFICHSHTTVYMEFIQSIFCKCFTDGDAYRALHKLRMRDLRNAHFHEAAYMFGLQGGVALLLLSWIGWTLQVKDDPETQELGVIYCGLFTPFFMAILSFLNGLIFHMKRVNYTLIFAFDRRKQQHPFEYGTYVGGFMCLYLLLAYLSLTGVCDSFMKPLHQPWLVCAIVYVFLVLPDQKHKSHARRWVLKAMWENFWSPFYHVYFRNFFLGDQFMSLGGLMQVIGLMMFYTFHGTADAVVHTHNSDPYRTWYMCLFLMVPGLVRLSQCIRRFYDTPTENRSFFPHLANAGKYTSGLVTIGLACTYANVKHVHGPYSDDASGMYGLVVFSVIVYQLYAGAWDIHMDFGMSGDTCFDRTHDEHRRFTQEFYNWMAPFTLALRACSMVPLCISYAGEPYAVTNTTVMIFWGLECVRRFCWNLLRVDNEHASNCDALQAIDVKTHKLARKWAREMFYDHAVVTDSKWREEENTETHKTLKEAEEHTTMMSNMASPKAGSSSAATSPKPGSADQYSFASEAREVWHSGERGGGGCQSDEEDAKEHSGSASHGEDWV
jgi:hypothetical protein